MERKYTTASLPTETKQIIGKKINKWTVIEHCGWNNHGKRLYLVRCECGNETKKRYDQVKLSNGCIECGKKSMTKYWYQVGQQVHNWTVLHKTNLSGNKYRCRCKCGRESNIGGKDLHRGVTTRCMACRTSARNKTHGLAGTKTYNVWAGIKQRCYNPNNQDYKRYGGRGIVLSDAWHDFQQFLSDMGSAKTGMTIDRIDSNGNYCKENCRWLSRSENAKRMHKEYVHISKLCDCCKKRYGLTPEELDRRYRKAMYGDHGNMPPIFRDHNNSYNF